MNDVFIYTEIFNCGKVGRVAIESFNRYHDLPLHVFGRPEDFKWIDNHKNLILHDDEPFYPSVVSGYEGGHLGTARLWANLIKTRPEKHFIHFDSDVVFRKEFISKFLEKLDYDLVGAIRNYKNNPHNNDSIRHLHDTISTNIFMFNKQKINDYPLNILTDMCQGVYNPHKHPVIDFFDPVMFDIIYNNGKVFTISCDDIGGSDNTGSRNNKYSDINNYNTPFKIDFGEYIIHYSAVGSGMNCFIIK